MTCKDNFPLCVDDNLSVGIPSIALWKKINRDMQKLLIQEVRGFPLIYKFIED